MPTAHTSQSAVRNTQKRSAASKSQQSSTRAPDAIKLLKADHAAVKALFKEFEGASGAAKQQQIAQQICTELTIHTQIEEELFYPAAREALEDDDMLDEAKVEHESAKQLIEQISNGEPGAAEWEARVTVLKEYIEHHVKEEEQEMFPAVRKSDLDLKELGQQLQARKQELQQESA